MLNKTVQWTKGLRKSDGHTRIWQLFTVQSVFSSMWRRTMVTCLLVDCDCLLLRIV